MKTTNFILNNVRTKKFFFLILLMFGLVGNINAEDLIIDGEKINISQRPYTALIVRANEPGSASCSAVIIDDKWVLTAGHCVDQGVNTDDILVKVDVNVTQGEVQVLEVEEIFSHPGFSTEGFTQFGNDIALLKLKTPVTFNNRVQKIALATPADANLVTPGIVGTLSGWGDTSSNPEDPANFDLNTVDLPIVALSDANNVNAFNGRITANMLPAGSRSNNKGSCSGDSGGPFVVPDGNGGQILAGISSFGQCDEDVNGPFSVFTRISAHVSWVESVLNEEVFAWFEPSSNTVFDFEFLDLVNYTDLNNSNFTETTYSWEVKNSNDEVVFTSTLLQPRFMIEERGNYTISLTASNATGTSTDTKTVTVLGRCATSPKLDPNQLSVLTSGNNKISNFKDSNVLTMGYTNTSKFDQVISRVTVFFDTPLQLDANSEFTLALSVNGEGQEGFAELFLPDVENEINRDGKYTFELDNRVQINSSDEFFELSIAANSKKNGDDVSILTFDDPTSEAIFTTLDNNLNDGEEIIGTELALELGVCRTLNTTINQLPWVGFTNPTDYSTFKVGDPINLAAIAEDPENNIERVNFRVNGELLKSDNAAPYEQIFEPEQPGIYDIEAVVVDGANNRNKSFLTLVVVENINAAPEVSISSPLNNAEFTLGEDIPLVATATDPDGNLDKVNFKINNQFYKTDNSSPFENTFTPTEPGTYIIGARAFDTDGLSKEVIVTVKVNAPNQEPFVTITSPSDGQVFSVGEEIPLAATASDPDDNLEKVNFKIDDQFYKTDNTSPYENTYIATEPGTYKIAARAFDEDGLTFETFVTVTVEVTLSNESFTPNNKFENVTIYPSPAASVINVAGLSQDNTRASIIDATGKTLAYKVLSKNNNQISVSNLASGIYFLKLQTNLAQKSMIFVKE